MQRLSELVIRLAEADVEFVLVGGLAAAIHGSTLNTRDADICCRFSEANLMKLQKAMEGLNPVHRARPDLPLDLSPDLCARLKNLYLKTDWGIVDCLGEVLGVGGYDEVLRHSIPVNLPGGTIRILDRETLIQAKIAMGRPHDLITVDQLRRIPSASELNGNAEQG
ncbi:MAG: hypothetical protein KDM63_18270 [Verrucomicrobiae bacterium]|nr:hypothetical protein [Verrucomicrobiae bacterium]